LQVVVVGVLELLLPVRLVAGVEQVVLEQAQVFLLQAEAPTLLL
jgi:hypothetical protein